MSEHIKTGFELFKLLSDDEISEDDEWASLSWLREKIKQKKTDEVWESYPMQRLEAYDWFLSLLDPADSSSVDVEEK